MIHQGANNVHWNYFLALDADTSAMSRYIEFTEKNFDTYSVELARLLMAAASEVDVLAKTACSRVAPAKKPGKIDQYKAILATGRPNLESYPVQIRRYGLVLTPWSNWTSGTNPLWWRAYNDVKHERNNHYSKANLKNALNAVAGLFVMLIYAFPDEASNGQLVPIPSLFSIPDSHVTGSATDLAGSYFVDYKL